MGEEQISLDFGTGRRVYQVAELNAAIRALLDSRFQDIWVAGEISGVKLATSGHYYFTLKDEQAQLRCVCFRASARYLRFKPQDGIAVLARGRIDVYEPRGEYQLLVESIEPQGYGALQLAFEQLKKQLAGEGLFDPQRKRALPKLPGRIGIVTSPTGAVIRDMLQILQRRFPGLHIRLFPAQVQGAGSIGEVVTAIDWFSQSGWPEVVIVARGGGSIEDLWTFNEEAVARAIARSAVPVVSAVGHETDVTIADFVADLRAPTPSAAAELVVGTREQLAEQFDSGITRAASALRRSLGRRLQRVDEIDFRLRSFDPRLRLAAARRRQALAWTVLCDRVRLGALRARGRLDSLSARLNTLSPLGILERGYAIVQDETGRIVKNAEDAPPKSLLDVRLAQGRLRARVTRAIPAGSSELPS
ncbi:MAG TPA: exodeoxyribonuclease VII large subunit [Bryobacteraceae bacterium]|nr:exodeoxyribonuclease VII large subunit [Bryobacteraceae bacterium]